MRNTTLFALFVVSMLAFSGCSSTSSVLDLEMQLQMTGSEITDTMQDLQDKEVRGKDRIERRQKLQELKKQFNKTKTNLKASLRAEKLKTTDLEEETQKLIKTAPWAVVDPPKE